MRSHRSLARARRVIAGGLVISLLTVGSQLDARAQGPSSGPAGQTADNDQNIQSMVREFLAERLGIPREQMQPDRDLVEALQIDRTALYYELLALYTQRGVEPPPVELRTIEEIAQFLASAPKSRDVDIGGAPISEFYVQKVYFATDRQRTDARASDNYFAGTRAALGQITYGVAEVDIPQAHKPGQLEEPSWFAVRAQKRDPRQYIFVEDIAELDPGRFFQDIGDKLRISASGQANDILVYIHGFNNSFDYAMRRAAQIAIDYGFKGATIMYSWPSSAQASPNAYNVDWSNVLWSVEHFESFLADLLRRYPDHKVHLVAHSMGSMGVLHALRLMAARGTKLPKIANVILCAPDFDADLFKQQIALEVRDLSMGWAIYSSLNDQALALSRKVNGATRLGIPVTLADGYEVIDASEVEVSPWNVPETHSYYAMKLPVIADITGALRGFTPQQRKLRGMQVEGGTVWYLPK